MRIRHVRKCECYIYLKEYLEEDSVQFQSNVWTWLYNKNWAGREYSKLPLHLHVQVMMERLLRIQNFGVVVITGKPCSKYRHRYGYHSCVTVLYQLVRVTGCQHYRCRICEAAKIMAVSSAAFGNPGFTSRVVEALDIDFDETMEAARSGTLLKG